MIIEIAPLDTLFFRDGKPFSMGKETWADGIFPPSPSTIYGALRSKYFSENIEKFQELEKNKKLDKEGDPTKKLTIKNYVLEIENNLFFPLPLDLIEKKYKHVNPKIRQQIKRTETREKRYEIEQLKPIYIDNDQVTNLKTEVLLTHNEEVESIDRGYYKLSNLKSYLIDKNIAKCKKLADFLTNEPKVGIKRNYQTHTSSEGNLYRIGMQRLKNIKIVVRFENLDIPEKGILKLGGESKPVHYRVIDQPEIQLPEIDRFFKLYISTPAIFDKGWLPSWIDEENLEGKLPHTNIKVKLLTAVVGKYINIGGFDIKNRKPKTMYKAVPAGSVYYFKILEGDPIELNKIQETSISDKRKEEGFGISYIGKNNMEE